MVHRTGGGPDLLEGGGEDERVPVGDRLSERFGLRLPAGAQRALGGVVVAGLLAVALWPLMNRPAPAAVPPQVSDRQPSVSSADAQLGVSRAIALRTALIKGAPADFRAAAAQASARSGRRTPPEFFLALAYNRTLYGALLQNSSGWRYANRGPLQWQLADFARSAVPGHLDPTKPLDAFLAVDRKLQLAGAAPAASAYEMSLRLGSEPARARADAETFEILREPTQTPAPVP